MSAVSGEPLDHIARPNLPWRPENLTECGKDTNTVEQVITRDQALAKVGRQGKQRAAMSTCMTCWNAAEWNRDWAQSPTEVMAREVKRGRNWSTRVLPNTDTPLDRELRAVAALVEAHRDEFDGYLSGLGATADLASKRLARARGRATDPHTRRL